MKEQELPDSKKKSNKLVFKFPTQYFIQAQYKKNVTSKHQESDHVFYCLCIIPSPPLKLSHRVLHYPCFGSNTCMWRLPSYGYLRPDDLQDGVTVNKQLVFPGLVPLAYNSFLEKNQKMLIFLLLPDVEQECLWPGYLKLQKLQLIRTSAFRWITLNTSDWASKGITVHFQSAA